MKENKVFENRRGLNGKDRQELDRRKWGENIETRRAEEKKKKTTQAQKRNKKPSQNLNAKS